MTANVAQEAHELTTQVCEFRAEVRQRTRMVTALLVVGALLFAFTAYGAYTARSAAQNNSRALVLIQQILNPDSQIRKESTCTHLVLHNIDGPECAHARQALIDAGATIAEVP